MKNLELKDKFKNKYAIKVIAGVLSIALIGGSVGVYSAYAAKENAESVEEAEDTETEEEIESAISKMINHSSEAVEIGKDETVYLIANAKGEVSQTIVSDWLKNPTGAEELSDKSDLKDITNVKGEESFTQSGDNVTWQAGGNDIYYQGTTEKQAPVTEKVTYYLDGKEIEPDELAGKSGKVTIRFDYTNHEKVQEVVNGKNYEVSVPFTVVTGMILNDNFTNVEVNNGRVISEGKNNIVVGLAMPGLADSLQLEKEDFDEEVEFPEYVEVTADVEDFSLDMTITVVTNELLSAMNLDGTLDLSSVDDMLDEMTDAGTQLEEGSGDLKEGIGTLKDGLVTYTDGASTIAQNLKTLADGTTSLNEQVPTLVKGVDDLKDGTASALSGAQQLSEGAKTATAGAKQLNDAYAGDSGVANGAKSLDAGVSQLCTGLNSLLTQVSGGASTYSTQAKSLYASDDAANAALTQDLTAYVTAQVTYQNLGRGILDMQTSIQTSLASVGGSITSMNAKIPDSAAAFRITEIDPSAFSLPNYMSFDETTGEYTLQDGLAANVKALGTGARSAAAAIDTKKTTTESTAKGLLMVDAESAAGLLEVAGAEQAMADSLRSSADSLDGAEGYAAQLETLTAQFNAAKNARDTAYAKLASTDESNPGTIMKVCTYYGTSGAATALTTINDSLAKAGLNASALQQLQGGANDIDVAINGGTLSNGTKVEQGLAQGTNSLYYGLQGYDKADGTHQTGLAEGLTSLADGLSQLDSGLGTMKSSTPKLTAGVSSLAEGAAKLSSGANTLVANNQKLNNGAAELLDGSEELRSGMAEFNEKAIQKLADTYNGDIKSLVDRLDAVTKAGEDYTTFTLVSDDVKGSVKFILKTDAVKEKDE
ncbi:MAG: hypothetical protein IJ567_05070 [Lachnospiraceae bacterium]|nr:hypothetical protein [Lachnospiraceae bacterium]